MNGNRADVSEIEEIGSEVCPICPKLSGTNYILTNDHKDSDIHRLNFLLTRWENRRKKLVKNRNGIEVHVFLVDIINGNELEYVQHVNKGAHITKGSTSQLQLQNNRIAYLFSIKNISTKNIYLRKVVLPHPYNYFYVYDFEGKLEEQKPLELESGASYAFKVIFNPGSTIIGSFKMPVCMEFQTLKDAQFTIAREMVVIISDIEDTVPPEHKVKSPFTNLPWGKLDELKKPICKFIPHELYSVPAKYKYILKMGLSDSSILDVNQLEVYHEVRQKLEPGYPTTENYQDFFHFVLWLDEIGAELMLCRYNMENVKMIQKEGRYLELEVPGLAEKRPSLIVGDIVNIRPHEDRIAYMGIIQKVTSSSIYIQGINSELTEYIEENPDLELDVRFQLGRLSYERMHAAVDQCINNGMLNCLFPSENLANYERNCIHHVTEFINEDVAHNSEQRMAVEKILNGTSGKAPYIIFGPPGTGKTVTIVEAILQIKNKFKHTRILVCAPANAACDMLTTKLQRYCTRDELIRVHTVTREWETVPDEVKPYSNHKEEDYVNFSGKELNQFRIVIMTLVSSGRFANNQKYLPDFVFIDEAAQAMEPEANIAIALLKVGQQLVLAGDPKQLGPQCSSTVAEKYRLNVSLLERLMSYSLYQNSNPNYITMLKKNFRAHPVVLQLPNELFYSGQLQPESRLARADPIATIFIYNKIFPLQKNRHGKMKNLNILGEAVEFCAIFSKEKREGQSPSYFNQKEIEMVLKYVKALIELTEVPVREDEIGIVTPYVRQMHRIKGALKRLNLDGVEVGTTEVFQGREKRIIIISTVRAQHSLLLHDKRYKLGFIKNEKRFNVALTRARSKLIIIGCPNVLRYDVNWCKYIDFCEEKGAYFGAQFDRRDASVRKEIVQRMGFVKLQDSNYQ